MPSLAVVASGALITGTGLALSAVPAQAVTSGHQSVAGPHSLASAKPLSKSALSEVRARQSQMLSAGTTAPSFAKSGVKTFTVNTTEDSSLANPANTHCVDLASGKCSLRAAVEAANNLSVPVKIVLGKHTYTQSSATTLNVTNPAGTSIVGQGAGKTTIKGSGSGVFDITVSTSGPAGLLFLSNAKVTGGSATYGGGFYVDDSTSGAELVLNGVVVRGNTASSEGGGIYTTAYNSIYANDTKFLNNVAPYGAAMYLYWTNTNFTNVSINGNHSPAATTGNGGGIYNEYGVLRMKGGSISGNTVGDATSGGGGAGVFDYYGNLSFTGVHLDNNTANDGGYAGAVYSYYDLVEFNHGTMSHNRALGTDSDGGAIYQDYGSQIDLHGVTMAGNRVASTSGEGYGGGAIYLYGYDGYANQTTIDQGTKISGSNGSAIYAYADYGQIDLSIDHASLAGNHNASDNGFDAQGCGGAVCVYGYEYSTVNLSMSNTKVVDNSSTGNGGSGAVSVYAYYYGGASVSLRGNLFEKNVAGAGGYGGAVLFYDDDDYSPVSVRSQSNRFVANKAGTSANQGWGGALALYYYATFTDKGSSFAKNKAVGDGAYGGAISNESYQSARFVGTSFTGNQAGKSDGGNGYGGAVYTDDEAGTAFSKVTMSGNRSASYGGGIYADSSEYALSIDRSTISGNTAGTSSSAGYGGGIWSDEAPMTVDNSTIANNRVRSITGTPGQGGGIYDTDSPLDLRYSTVSGNTGKQGGGVYLDGYGGVILSSILSHNHKSSGGPESDCFLGWNGAKLHSIGGNVLGQKACVAATASGDKVTKNPKLGKLKDNGGPTKTMALSRKSPAVGRAMFQVPSTDQRGHGRPSKHADAGAYELPKKHKH